MTKKALERKLNELSIDKRAYDLNGGLPNETYCIEESNGKWYTYYSGSFANVGVGENNAVSGRIKCVQHSEKFS